MLPYFVLYCSASCVMIVGMWGKNERCKKPRLGDFRASLPTLSSVATQYNREPLQNICNLNLKTLQPRNLVFTFPSSRGFFVNVHSDESVFWENVLMSAAFSCCIFCYHAEETKLYTSNAPVLGKELRFDTFHLIYPFVQVVRVVIRVLDTWAALHDRVRFPFELRIFNPVRQEG